MGWYSLPNMIPCISMADISNPICSDEEDQIIYCSGRTKPLPTTLHQIDLPDECIEA